MSVHFTLVVVPREKNAGQVWLFCFWRRERGKEEVEEAQSPELRRAETKPQEDA